MEPAPPYCEAGYFDSLVKEQSPPVSGSADIWGGMESVQLVRARTRFATNRIAPDEILDIRAQVTDSAAHTNKRKVVPANTAPNVERGFFDAENPSNFIGCKQPIFQNDLHGFV